MDPSPKKVGVHWPPWPRGSAAYDSGRKRFGVA